MADTITKTVKELFGIIKDSDKKATSPYDTQAEVIRVIGKTAYVHIPGGVAETPVDMTVNVKVGDKVQVRVSGGRAWITGNATAPPTDDKVAIQATNVAKTAQKTATKASAEAAEAWQYAGTAVEAASVANRAANSALESADTAHQAADAAVVSANEAKESARSANNSANNALVQLSVVEDVAGTLRWISEHGDFVLTEDTTVKEGTVYFIYENGDYVPIASPDPTKNPSQEGWYILDVTVSQSKYIMSHLAVTSAGLWVLPVDSLVPHPLKDSDDNLLVDSDDNQIVDWSKDDEHINTASGYKVLLSGTGMTIYNNEGEAVAFYGEYARIGKSEGNNVYIDSDSVDIRDGETAIATFGGTTIRIGKNDASHIVLQASNNIPGLDIYDSSNISGGRFAINKLTITTSEGNKSKPFLDIFGSTRNISSPLSIVPASETVGGYREWKEGIDDIRFRVNDFTVFCKTANNQLQQRFTVTNEIITINNSVEMIGDITINGDLDCKSMDSGQYQDASVAAGDYEDYSIIFNHSFSSAPIVVATPWSTSIAPGMGNVSVAVHTITTTGFKVRLFNNDSSTRSPHINWIAMLT